MPISPKEAALLHKFATQYGLFMIAWSGFEISIEVSVAKALGLSPRNASVTLGGLGFGSKVNILKSLLNQSKENGQKIATLTSAISIAERNALIHSYLSTRGETFIFRRREVKDKHIIRSKSLTVQQMTKHTSEFIEAAIKAQAALGVSEEEWDDYLKSIND